MDAVFDWRRALLRCAIAWVVAFGVWWLATPVFDRLLAAALGLALPALDSSGPLERVSLVGREIVLELRGREPLRFVAASAHFDAVTFFALFLGATALSIGRAALRALAVYPLLLALQVAAIYFELQWNYASLGIVDYAPGTTRVLAGIHVFFSTMGVLFFPILLWAAFGLPWRRRAAGAAPVATEKPT